MAIKIICEDARLAYSDASSRMQSSINSFESTLGKLAKISGDIGVALSIAKISPSRFQEISESAAEFKIAVNVIKNSLASAAWKDSEINPVLMNFSDPNFAKLIFGKKPKGYLFLFKNKAWEISGPFSSDEAKLMLLDRYKKQRSGAEFLTYRRDNQDVKYERTVIPENVKSEVWRRDQAKCVYCGGVYNLEFDHIIPLSKGGSNTVRNLQLLCETCNRSKSNSI